MHRVAALAAFALTLASVPSLAGTADISALFGSRIQARSDFKQPFATADFDGHGAAASVTIVRILPRAPKASVARDVTVQTFWGDEGIDPAGEALALAIVMAKSGKKFLIHGANYFGSPIWQEHDLPLHVAYHGSKEAREFARQHREIKNDILVLGTEAGIDTALYFDGRKFVLYEPPEEP